MTERIRISYKIIYEGADSTWGIIDEEIKEDESEKTAQDRVIASIQDQIEGTVELQAAIRYRG